MRSLDAGARATAADLDPAIRVALERLNAERTYPKRFLVRASKGLYFGQTSEIEWVDAQGNYMRLHAAGKAHMVRATMKTFERQRRGNSRHSETLENMTQKP